MHLLGFCRFQPTLQTVLEVKSLVAAKKRFLLQIIAAYLQQAAIYSLKLWAIAVTQGFALWVAQERLDKGAWTWAAQQIKSNSRKKTGDV